MRSIITSTALLALLAAPALAEQTLDGVAADTYRLDKPHAFLTWTVVHNGLSDYTVDFTDFDATLDFNPEEPTASTVEVRVAPLDVPSLVLEEVAAVAALPPPRRRSRRFPAAIRGGTTTLGLASSSLLAGAGVAAAPSASFLEVSSMVIDRLLSRPKINEQPSAEPGDEKCKNRKPFLQFEGRQLSLACRN